VTGGRRGSDFDGLTCSAPDARADRMAALVLEYAPADRPIRVLDLGCGTGGLVFRLAAALPQATCLGIDISSANIAAAKAARLGRVDADRISFEVVDYLSWESEPFDVVTVDGVLHLIPEETSRLVAKLAQDLKPGGLLINAMPYACAYNAAFAVVRKVLRATRTAVVDAMILKTGRLLHPEMDDDRLRERVHYMYLPPQRVMGTRLQSDLAARGLRIVAARPIASTSLAQLRHSVTVLRRDS
jgi:trans-aconitate methyltransferase